MSGHTPGPWEVEAADWPDAGDEHDGTVRYYVRHGEPLINALNARLIAAAPAMYQKLDKLATWLERNAEIMREAASRHGRFQSIADDELANAKNYEATARDIRQLLAKAEGKDA